MKKDKFKFAVENQKHQIGEMKKSKHLPSDLRIKRRRCVDVKQV